jgi:hypothetical protein
MLRRISLAATAGLLLLPAAASAGTLSVSSACVEQSQAFTVAGTGFTPQYSLDLEPGGSVYPESDGSFADFEIIEQPYDLFTPKTVTLTATDQVNAANDATTTYQVVKFGSNMPVTTGNPGSKVAWQFAGFPSGTTVYGHFRYHDKTLKDYRFGKSSGPCGLLSVKAPRIPVKKPKHTGGWYLQIDAKPKFSMNTRPEYDISFEIR